MAATLPHSDPQSFFLTPTPRHLAELRIDPAPSVVAFSAPCAAAAGRKRRCLLPASSPRKRMLLELSPFDVAPAPASTPPPPPSRTPSPSPPPSSPMASRPGATLSPAGEFSFGAGLSPAAVAFPGAAGVAGNISAFYECALRTPGGSDASSALSFLASQGKPATPTATGPTASGGFGFASPEQQWLTPTGSNTSGRLSFLASPKQLLTPTCSTASVGFFAPLTYEPSLTPTGSTTAAASLFSPKPARTGSTDGAAFAFPSPGPACARTGSPASAAGKETVPPAGLVTPAFVFSASPPPHKSGGGSRKRPRPLLRIDATPRVRNLRKWEEEPPQQFTTPSPQKVAKTNASAAIEASRSSIVSASTGRPCCEFFASPPKAAKQEAKKADNEASRSPAGSRCASPARPFSEEKAIKPEREVEVSSAACSGAEVVVRVTCKCGVNREFSFDHRR